MRRLFTILSIVSLLIFIATAALWARTVFAQELLIHQKWDESAQRFTSEGVMTLDGRIYAWRDTVDAQSGSDVTTVRKHPRVLAHKSIPAPPRGALPNSWGWSLCLWNHSAKLPVVNMEGISGPGMYETIHFGVRMWPIAMTAIILPSMWLFDFQRRRGEGREGLCPKCGYDLRASAERCPECGMEIAIAPAH